jgi:uncharacterized membrane protein
VSEPAREELSLDRVEAYSDAIFAFAGTLLALTIAVPSAEEAASSNSLLRALQAELPSFATFAVTFVLLGGAWVSHHRMVRMFRRADHTMVWLNLLLLLVVAFSPFPTAVLGRALGHDGARVAAFPLRRHVDRRRGVFQRGLVARQKPVAAPRSALLKRGGSLSASG